MDNEAALAGNINGNTSKHNKYFRVRIDALHDSYSSGIIHPKFMRSKDLPADDVTKSNSGPHLWTTGKFLQ